MTCRRLVALANGRVSFHRAFDFTNDSFDALERLIALGFRRVLTSGGAASALGGVARIAELFNRAGGRIEVLPGGGIRAENVAEIVRTTGCDQVHSAARTARVDHCLSRHIALSMAMGANAGGEVPTTDANVVAALRSELDRPPSLT